MPSIQTNAPRQSSDATSPRTNEQGSARNFMVEMWERLSQVGTQLQDIILPREIGSNPATVICPAHTAVAVDTCSRGERKSSWIHANIIKFSRESSGLMTDAAAPTSAKKVMAGQSPKTFDQTEKVLIQALDSDNGFVQLVSSNEERSRQRHLRPTITEQLRTEYEKCLRLGQPMILGERYQVVDIAVNSTNEQHHHYLLTASDLTHAGQQKTIPLTQIGLDFSVRVLRVVQIEEANALLENHLALRDQYAMPTSAQMIDPNILSHAGIGRNAALITYREGLSRIRAGLQVDALDNTLEEIVAQGRRDRGPKFLHSCAQLHEVREALLKALQERDHGQHSSTHSSRLRATSRSSLEPRHAGVLNPVSHATSPGVPPETRDAAVFRGLAAEAVSDQSAASPRGEFHPGIRQYPVTDNAGEGVLTSALNNAVDIEVAAVEISTTPPQRVLACLTEHGHDSNLQLFEALSRENTEAAAFCAVQVQRMMTPTEEPGRLRHMRRSLHADMDVTAPNDGSVNQTLAPPELMPNRPDETQNNDGKYRRPSPQPATALILGIEEAMRLKQDELLPDPKNASCFFPQGLAAALKQGRVSAPLNQHEAVEKLTLDQLTAFLADHKNASLLQLLEQLVPANPVATALVHFLDQALLISGAPDRIQTERFQYATNEERGEFSIKSRNAEATFPTFLPGINRAFTSNSAQENVWRITVAGEPCSVKSKPELITHVINNALTQMINVDAQGDGKEIYPLIVYELLAKIAGDVQVPEHVIAHEGALINAARENKERRIQQKVEKQTTFRANEDAYQKRMKIAEEEMRKINAAEGFHTPLQAVVGAGSYSEDLVTQSVDVRIPLIGHTSDIDLTKLIGASLEQSHDRQAIDNRGLGVRVDKRSWLRTAWLSVLSLVKSPDELADRLNALKDDVNLASHKKQSDVVKAIASYFAENPRGFMQGVLPDDTNTSGAVMDWPENLQHRARLGSAAPMDYVLGKWLPENTDLRLADKTVEEYLKVIHTDIAAAFRSTDAGIMPFLASLMMGYENGGSTLPVAFHRGLGLPVMVIEQGNNDRFTDEGVPYIVAYKDMRVAAPVGSELAGQITSLEDASSIDPSAVQALLKQFDDKPVIWLQHGTYSLYLPKELTRAGA